MKNILKITFVAIILVANVYSQDKLKFDFDFAKFSYDSSSVFVEFYYAFENTSLTVADINGQNRVQFTLGMTIQNSETGQVVLDREWSGGAVVEEKEDSKRKNLIGTLSMILPFGKYDLNIKGSDKNKVGNKKEINETIEILDNVNSKNYLSDIQLATSIRRQGTDENSIFYKNGMEIVPNPTSMYGEDNPILYYYIEIIPESFDGKTVQNNLNLVLYNGSQKAVYTKSKIISIGDNTIYDVGLINLLKYPTGSYSLAIELANSSTGTKSYSNKKVFLYNPSVIDTTVIPIAVNNTFLTSQFSTYSVEECDNHYDVIKYIMTQNQKDTYKETTNLDKKRENLFEFWKNLDPVPETPQNEYFIDFMARLKHVNANLKTKYKKGYQTERGRIFLKYGKPDQIDRHPFDSDTKPYEIWYYDSIEGGVLFIFADLTGYNNYVLLHSTKRGEPQDPSWNQKIIQVY